MTLTEARTIVRWENGQTPIPRMAELAYMELQRREYRALKRRKI